MTKKKILSMICITTLTTSLLACSSVTETNDASDAGKLSDGTSGNYFFTEDTTTEGATADSTNSTIAAADKSYTQGYTATTESMSDSLAAEPETPRGDYEQNYNTEEYLYIKENSFLSVSSSPLSTFAADVDTGSYTNFRRMITDGYRLEEIPQGAIRTEEMINYFDYAPVEFIDDDSRFGISYETNICPWNEDHELLMLTVQAKDSNMDYVGNNFVFLIDSSGSMNSKYKGEMAVDSFKLLAETLTEDDRVSIVTYSGSSETLLDSCPGDEYKEICKALDSISFGGGTNGSGGITAAYELAMKNFMEGGNNRVIIASDGDMNLGITSHSGLTELITEKKESGVFLTVLGYGSGNYSDANMESIADCGNGNYYYIDCLDEAGRVLVEKLKQTTVTVAKDVKLQVEFNPSEVSEYRLLGYENRTMAAEDFKDDTKDGGETGAGQTVTVLYELVRGKNNSTENELKYQANPTLTDEALTGELLTLSIRYKEPTENSSVEETFNIMAHNGSHDKMSKDFSFVAGIAELSMLMNNSDYLGTTTFDSALHLLREGITYDNLYRKELYDMLNALH